MINDKTCAGGSLSDYFVQKKLPFPLYSMHYIRLSLSFFFLKYLNKEKKSQHKNEKEPEH